MFFAFRKGKKEAATGQPSLGMRQKDCVLQIEFEIKSRMPVGCHANNQTRRKLLE